MSTYNVKDDIIRRSIKIFDLTVFNILYVVMAYIVMSLMNSFGGEVYLLEEQRRGTPELIGLVAIRIAIYTVSLYIIRNIVQLIPFPLEGVSGYKHLMTSGAVNAATFMSFSMAFDTTLRIRTKILEERISRPIIRG